MDFVRCWSEKTEIGTGRFIEWLGIAASKFYSWRERYGKVNEHNGWIPRDHWLEESEKQAILDFHTKNPLEALCDNMTETSCVTAISEQGGKETQHDNVERGCPPGVTRDGEIRFCCS